MKVDVAKRNSKMKILYSKDWNTRTVWNKRTGGKILNKQ